MNRIIKFRAWQKNHKKIGRVKSISFNEKSEIEHLCFHNGDNCAPVYSNYWKNHKEWDLDNLELMEFTGLKDKNGVEIYEGDILAYENTLNFKTVLQNHFEIKWEDYGNGMVGFTQFSPRNKFVVCGNIYENPELLNK